MPCGATGVYPLNLYELPGMMKKYIAGNVNKTLFAEKNAKHVQRWTVHLEPARSALKLGDAHDTKGMKHIVSAL